MSVVRMDSENAIVPELEETLVEVDTARIVKMNLPEWPYVLVGLLGSIVMGGAMPVYAILFGEVLGVLKLSSDEAREQSVFFLFTLSCCWGNSWDCCLPPGDNVLHSRRTFDTKNEKACLQRHAPPGDGVV